MNNLQFLMSSHDVMSTDHLVDTHKIPNLCQASKNLERISRCYIYWIYLVRHTRTHQMDLQLKKCIDAKRQWPFIQLNKPPAQDWVVGDILVRLDVCDRIYYESIL